MGDRWFSRSGLSVTTPTRRLRLTDPGDPADPTVPLTVTANQLGGAGACLPATDPECNVLHNENIAIAGDLHSAGLARSPIPINSGA